MTSEQRFHLEFDIKTKLTGLPPSASWGYRPGSKHFDVDLEWRQSARLHEFDNDPTVNPVQAAAWWSWIKERETQLRSNPRFYRAAMDHDPATRFLVRLAKQGNKDAARDLALSVTYQQWDDANISRDNSACRTITKSSCNFDDEQCDLFDPLKGHGTYASLFRRWSSIAMAE